VLKSGSAEKYLHFIAGCLLPRRFIAKLNMQHCVLHVINVCT